MNCTDYAAPLARWWGTLDGNRGMRARLRRARTPDDVYSLSEFHRGVIGYLQSHDKDQPVLELPDGLVPEGDKPALAFVAGLLAQAPELDRLHFAARLAMVEQDRGGSGDFRFRRLIVVGDAETDALFAKLRRLIIYTRTANVESLLYTAFHWNNETRRKWAERYYNPAPRKGDAS